MSYQCDICGKSFQTPQALKSHISYQHKRPKRIKEITTTTPPQILEDPEIIELRKQLEKRRLQRAMEELEDVPKIIDLSERTTKLEEIIKGIQDYQAKQDQTLTRLSNLVSNLTIQLDFIAQSLPLFLNPEIIDEKNFLYMYAQIFPKHYKKLEEAFRLKFSSK
jgi:hypothetical protein